MAAERGLDARDTPILAFPHKGGRDLSLAIRTRFRVAGLASIVWIPAFAGMTGRNREWRGEIGNGGEKSGMAGRNREWRGEIGNEGRNRE